MNAKFTSEQLVSKTEVARLLALTERTVDRYRSREVNPLPCVVLSQRNVRFIRADVEAWVAANRIGEVAAV